ncbi:MAG: hypothetical protein ACLT9J_10815 [Agathobacter rectalis]
MDQVLPIDTTGIDFAMTALFVGNHGGAVDGGQNRPSVLIGLDADWFVLLISAADNFILPTMISYYDHPAFMQKVFDKETEQKKE